MQTVGSKSDCFVYNHLQKSIYLFWFYNEYICTVTMLFCNYYYLSAEGAIVTGKDREVMFCFGVSVLAVAGIKFIGSNH